MEYIVDETKCVAGCYKPQSAYFEALGADGPRVLKDTVDYVRETAPTTPLILDAKRADIGSTNKGYIDTIFGYYGFDAVTVHPYLGREALRPFLECKDKGIIVLCRTSNPGAAEFQDLVHNGAPMYMHVAHKVVHDWNEHGNCMMVVGATYPKELAEIRAIARDMTFLIPGIGAQGGDLAATVKAGKNSKNNGMIINSARGIIYADNPRGEAKKLNDAIIRLRG